MTEAVWIIAEVNLNWLTFTLHPAFVTLKLWYVRNKKYKMDVVYYLINKHG